MGYLQIVVLSLLIALMGCDGTASTPIRDIEESVKSFVWLSQAPGTKPCIEFGTITPPPSCQCPAGGEIVTQEGLEPKSSFQGCGPSARLVYNGSITDQISSYEYDLGEFGVCTNYLGDSPIACQGKFTASCGGFPLSCEFSGPPAPGAPCEFEC